MKCVCGFKFSGPGEIRNCGAFVTANGDSGIICPKCDNAYINISKNPTYIGKWSKIKKRDK